MNNVDKIKKRKPIRSKGCTYCGGKTHTSLRCFSKPRQRPKTRKAKTTLKELETRSRWLQKNPGDVSRGVWMCYLRIHEWCPRLLSIETMQQEHVKPKSSYPKLKHDLDNRKPACSFCNGLKGSRSIENLAKEFPHLKSMCD